MFLKAMLVFLCLHIAASDIVVKTKNGNVKGKTMSSDKGLEFYAFLGLPYAKPPVKELRFQPPKPIKPWQKTLDATRDGHNCIQFDVLTLQFTGDEDCLYLNVYTPKLGQVKEPLAVMVFIHGGGFLSGNGASTLYGPERLLDKEVVLVTLNYRLGIFGFLGTGDKVSPGNYGLLDQVAALQWVKDNIADFGGDPNRVTIFGESAGGASVFYHLISPLSKGLFHAAIPQSGSAVCDWAYKDDPLIYTKKIASRLQCPDGTTKELVDCLKRAAPLDLAVKSTYTDFLEMANSRTIVGVGPTTDKVRGDKAFLPDSPKNLLSRQEVPNKVPTLSGITRDEGMFFLAFLGQMIGDPSILGPKVIPLYLNFDSINLTPEDTAIQYKILKSEYFSGVEESDVKGKLTGLSNFFSDYFMNYGIDNGNDLLAESGVPVYGYVLTYRGEHTFSDYIFDRFPSVPYLGLVSHVDDLQYLFRCGYFKSTALQNPDDLKIKEIMLNLWTNFAKTLTPKVQDENGSEISLDYTPITPNRYQYLDINLKPKIVESRYCNDHRHEIYDNIFSLSSSTKKDEL